MKKLLEEVEQLNESAFNDKHTIDSVIKSLNDTKYYLDNMDEGYPELRQIFVNIDKVIKQLSDLKKKIERYSF